MLELKNGKEMARKIRRDGMTYAEAGQIVGYDEETAYKFIKKNIIESDEPAIESKMKYLLLNMIKTFDSIEDAKGQPRFKHSMAYHSMRVYIESAKKMFSDEAERKQARRAARLDQTKSDKQDTPHSE